MGRFWPVLTHEADQAAQTLVVKLLQQSGKPAGLAVDHLHD